MIKLIFSAVALGLCATLADAAPKIAVVDFDTHQYSGELPGAQLADYVVDELVNTGLFDVIEREKLESVVRETAFGQSGMVDPSSASQFGRLLGANFLLTGRVVSLESEVKEFSGYGVNTRNTVVTLSVSIRVVEVETGTVRFSTRTKTQQTFNEGGGLRVASSNPYSELAEQAAVDMVGEIQASGRFAAAAERSTAGQESKLISATILSAPPGADVEVDGVFYGNTGGIIQIPSGLRKIRISLAGHIPWQKQVMVNEGSKFTATLAPVPDE